MSGTERSNLESNGKDDEKANNNNLCIKLGPVFFKALDIKHRPIIPFINRGSKVPRSIRQKVLDRLVGQHLALTAIQTGLEKTPNAAVSDEGLRQHAVSLAVAQEGELYSKAGSGNVYSVVASQSKASTWVEKKEKERILESTTAANKDEKHNNTSNKKRKRHDSQSSGKTIEEADLLWDKAMPEAQDIRKRLVAAIEKNQRCMNELDAQDRVEIADKCTKKIMGYSSLGEKDVTDENIVEFVEVYAVHIQKKKKLDEEKRLFYE